MTARRPYDFWTAYTWPPGRPVDPQERTMYRIGKDFKFDAAHQLGHLPDDHKCARLHGHTYHVVFHLEADELDADGFVIDYGELAPVKRWIDATLDHRNLNDVVPPGVLTTAEAMAAWLFEEWCDSYPNLVAVTVKETEATYSEYRP